MGVNLPAWLPEQLWADWLAHRELLNEAKPPSRRKPYTKVAQKRAILKLGRFREQGMDPVAVVERAMDKGWDGFWPLPDRERTVFKEPRVNGSELSLAEQDALSWKRKEPPRPRAAGDVAKRFLDDLRERLSFEPGAGK